MAKKERKYVDDGWAVWLDGENVSTVYINDWLNPKGKSYVDLAIRVRGVKACKNLYAYVPFGVSRDEISDVSLLLQDRKVLQAIFSSACIVDYMKNEHTSEIAYNAKTVDIIHISTLEYGLKPLADGTLISVNLESIQTDIANDEAYFIWRMPHKSLNEIFRSHVSVGNILGRLRDLITTPVISEKYGYSVRVNESRLLPEEINKIGTFHRQKLKKALITVSIKESYEINDLGCYRIHRLEENLYEDFLPKDYKTDDVITYQWHKERGSVAQGQFNFYYNISKESVNSKSMTVYMILLMLLAVMGEILGDFAKTWLGLQ